MNAATDVAPPTWIARLPKRPLCDVPWLGRSVVLSDGGVNFCCYSDAVVGNVNQQPLQEIWSGPTMRRIRATLVKQHFPKECQSHSCPIFRGDRHSYLLDRMDGPRAVDGRDAPFAVERDRLQRSRLLIAPARVRAGEPLRIAVELSYAGAWIAPDLFVGVTRPDGSQIFLPEFAEFPLPYARAVDLSSGSGAVTHTIVDTPVDSGTPPGDYEVCAALFAPDSNPNLAVNCLWSARRSVTIGS